jgi:hypothetical protein
MIDRRDFLRGALLAPFLGPPVGFAAEDHPKLGAVPPLDTSMIKPSDFSDDDLDMPFALSHFAQLANSVVLEGPERGFINISVWRGTNNLHPYNARIMESILTLAWFYTAPQPWNQYRANPELRKRLELAMEYWCDLQSPDGKFSEYGPQQWNLAATAFAVKFISEAQRLLRSGPPVSATVHHRTIEGCRKALRATLYDPDLISQGRSFSNQYTNVFAGGAAFLALYPDAELSARLSERVSAMGTELQSPCGYMYEKNGPDLGYTLNTHHENLQMAYHYWRRTPLGDLLVEQENRFSQWLMYNLLPEPGQDFFVANRSIETRQKHAIFAPIDTPLADRCPIMRAYATPPDRRAAQILAAREKLDRQWPEVDPLDLGAFDTLGPYRFLQRAHYNWHPSQQQITEARQLVRPLAEPSFVEQLMDTRRPIVFTYVRRPSYYAAFAAAPRPLSEQQRLGLTWVWTPARGVLLQSETSGAETAWGTSAGVPLPIEADGLEAEYGDDKTTVRYPLAGGGEKRIAFAEDRIRVWVERSGELVEHLPVFDPKLIGTSAQISTLPQSSSPVPGKDFTVVELRASGKLEYEIRPVV